MSCIFATLSALLFASPLLAQGTAFTYQGRLNNDANAANGIYDVRFAVHDSADAGSVIAGPITNAATVVSNGLFTLTLDFGASVFNGAQRWLEIGVRSNGSGAFATLSPRQPITATPYSIRAANVDASGLAGTIPSSSLSGIYTAPVTFDNPSNSYNGTFYGSFLGLSFIGGSFAGSFIGNGSGLANLNGSQITSGTIPAAALNNAWRPIGNSGTIPGTHFVGNTDNKPLEFRINNQRVLFIGTNANGAPNLVAGSPANSITGTNIEGSTIAGGGLGFYPNTITASYATIGGGTFHTVNGVWSTIAGGRDNVVQADHSTIAGGRGNIIRPFSEYATIAGGGFNVVNSNSSFGTIGGGYFNGIHDSYATTIGGGQQNNIGANSIAGTIGGGEANRIATNSYGATIAGGGVNNIGASTFAATISGGNANVIAEISAGAIISGGLQNQIGANSAAGTIGGGSNNRIGDNSSGSVIAGGGGNQAGTDSSTAVIGGGYQNIVFSNSMATVGGGFFNQVGGANRATYASLFPSQGNTVAGGSGNFITEGSRGAFIGGGNNNSVLTNGDYAMIPGGELNDASAYAFAAGRYAKANHQGAFVWGDSTPMNISSLSPDSVTMRASGGYRLFSNSGATAGVSLAPGGTSWAVISDRNAKKDFAAVDSRAILEKLAALPITRWHYCWEEKGTTPHIGPMAQDFKAAFYPGRDNKSITTQEADGVALAAIQGLNQKLEQELEQKETEITELKQRLAALEKIILNQP